MWSLGDYREVAPFLLPHAEALVASSSIAPVVLGGGKRLFDHFDETVSLEHQRLLQSPFATHITYRIVR